MQYPTIAVDPVIIGNGILPARYPGESIGGDMSPAYIRHHQGWLESADFGQHIGGQACANRANQWQTKTDPKSDFP